MAIPALQAAAHAETRAKAPDALRGGAGGTAGRETGDTPRNCSKSFADRADNGYTGGEMKRKYNMSELALATRRQTAAKRAARGKKAFVTMRVEPDAKKRVTDYVADPRNNCQTLSEALRRVFCQ